MSEKQVTKIFKQIHLGYFKYNSFCIITQGVAEPEDVFVIR